MMEMEKKGMNGGQAGHIGTKQYANPVLPGQFADPDLALFGDTYYLYATTDGFPGWSGTQFHVFSSKNLVDFTDGGIILDVAGDDVAWSVGSAWAPCIQEKDGKYYFYFCAKDKAGDSHIGVASADDPAGPFTAMPEPLITKKMCIERGIAMGQTIDPSVFTDEDGASYLLFGNGNAAVVRLNEDMVSLDFSTLKNYEGAKDFREAVTVTKRGGVYHFTWSCDDTGSPDYHVNYGTSDSIYGPITYRYTVLEKDEENGILGTGHHCILSIPGCDEYYIAYHRFYTPLGTYTEGLGFHRETCIDALYFDKETGLMLPVKPTKEGVAAREVPKAPGEKKESEKKVVRPLAELFLLALTLFVCAVGCGKKDDAGNSQVLQDGQVQDGQMQDGSVQSGQVQDGQSQDADSGAGSGGKDTDMGKKEDENQEMEEFENDFEHASAGLRMDYEALTVHDADAVRGNLYLAAAGEYGSEITWESSDPSVITAKEQPQEGYDAMPAGVVARQAQDVKVKLYAYLTKDGVTLRKDFEVTVLARPEEGEYTDYLFSYFVGNGVNQENIFFATSEDGFSWKDTNNGQPVLTTQLGTTGIRDPFLLRSTEGDRFFLIATDLCIAKDGDWGKAQRAGSQSIFIWESMDLVNWSEPRLVKVNSSTAGCTWAPEAFYDELTGEYLVFWASRVASDNYAKQRIYYVKTRDFYNFTKPKAWIDYPFSVIDTTVIRDGGTYYRFTKYEDKSRIIMECSDKLLGEWTEVKSETLSSQEGVEGPCCFELHEKDRVDGNRFCLLLDHFVGSGYYMMITDDLGTAEFERKKGYSLPQKRPRHGTVIPVTREEYERVTEYYNQ